MAITEADRTFIDAKPTGVLMGGGGTVSVAPSVSGGTKRKRKKVDREAEMREQLRQAEITRKTKALEQKRDTALAELETEEAKIKPLFDEQRSQLSRRSQMQARNMAEFLANRGASRSGGAISLEQSRQNELSKGLTDIGLAQTGREADIAKARRLIGTGFAQDVEAIQAGADERALADELNRFRQTQAQERADFGSTIGRFSQDFQAEINRINDNIARGDSSEAYKIPFLENARQQKITVMANQEAEIARQQEEANIEAQRQAIKDAERRLQLTGVVNSEEDARLLGVPVGTTTAGIRIAEINRANRGGSGGETSFADLRSQAIKNLENFFGKRWDSKSVEFKEQAIADEIAKLSGKPVTTPTPTPEPTTQPVSNVFLGDDVELATVQKAREEERARARQILGL